MYVYNIMYITDMKQVLTKLRKNGIDLLSTKPLTSTTTTATSSSSSPSPSGGHNSDPSREGHNSDREVPEIRIENYHEMSMREARRCDLRNGTAMKSLAATTTSTTTTTTTQTYDAINASCNGTHATTTTQASAATQTSTAGVQGPTTAKSHTTTTHASRTATQASAGELAISRDSACVDLRGHRGVMAVLTEVANPPSGELASGNWVGVYFCICA